MGLDRSYRKARAVFGAPAAGGPLIALMHCVTGTYSADTPRAHPGETALESRPVNPSIQPAGFSLDELFELGHQPVELIDDRLDGARVRQVRPGAAEQRHRMVGPAGRQQFQIPI